MSAKFMKVKVKRLIAREGLIIISLLLLAGISFALDLWLQDQRSFYYANVQEIEPIVVSPLTKTDPFSLTKTNPAAAAGFSEGVAA